MEKGYNGYTNYETWNLNLWASNTEAPYNVIKALKPFSKTTANLTAKWLFPNGTPDMSGPKDFEKVNWAEIVEAWNEY